MSPAPRNVTSNPLRACTSVPFVMNVKSTNGNVDSKKTATLAFFFSPGKISRNAASAGSGAMRFASAAPLTVLINPLRSIFIYKKNRLLILHEDLSRNMLLRNARSFELGFKVLISDGLKILNGDMMLSCFQYDLPPFFTRTVSSIVIHD